MKNRIYKIKDKILVQGNENELTENEVLVKEENGSVVLKERVNDEVKDIVVANKGKQLLVYPSAPTNQQSFSFNSVIFDIELNVSYEELKTVDSIKIVLDQQEILFNKFGEMDNAICFLGGAMRGDNTAIILNPTFLVIGENFSYQIAAQGGIPLS